MPKPKREKPRREKVRFLRDVPGLGKADDVSEIQPARAYALMNSGHVAPAPAVKPKKPKPD